MLTRVEIENFKAIESLSMDFDDRLTVIVGPNGSGKTSILQAILCLGFAYPQNAQSYLHGGPPGFLEGQSWYYGASTSGLRSKIRMEYQFDKDVLQTEVVPPKQNGNPKEVDFFHSQIVHSEMVDRAENAKANWKALNGNEFAAHWFPKPAYLELNPTQLASPSQIRPDEPILDADGRNLANVLAYLQTACPGEFATLLTGLQQVIPSIQLVRTHRVGKWRDPSGKPQNGTADEVLLDTLTVKGMPARFASEGTLLILALLAAIVQPTEDSILLLDGIDLALHPAAQAEAIDLIRKLLDAHPGLQIIATTHSPYLLNSLEFNQIRLTTLNDRGQVVCGRLTDHPHFERWKKEMTPGEMWGMWGEAWLTKVPHEAVQT